MDSKPLRLILHTVILAAAIWRFAGHSDVALAEPEAAPDELPRVPATDAAAALATFQIRDGFRIELVAS